MADLYENPWQSCPAPNSAFVQSYYNLLTQAISTFNRLLEESEFHRTQGTDYWMEKIEEYEQSIFLALDRLQGQELLEKSEEIDRGPITEPAPLAEDEAPEEWKPLYRPPTSSS